MPPGAPPQSITLLHVSDMQFGRNHRFGRLGALAPDAPFDTLLQRLTADLRTLEKGYGLKPQIVIASGDLAEWGLRSEFEDARKFLEALGKFLGITRDRVVIVPGNHDINRKSCEAYFNQCVADQTDPVSPFWQKWKHFAAMFAEFYRELPAPPRFSVQEYWCLNGWERKLGGPCNLLSETYGDRTSPAGGFGRQTWLGPTSPRPGSSAPTSRKRTWKGRAWCGPT